MCKVLKVQSQLSYDKTSVKRETWFAADFENDASEEGDSNSQEDGARDGEEHPPLQNYTFG